MHFSQKGGHFCRKMHNFRLRLQFSQKLFSNFSSNLAYELLMTLAFCSINAVLLESLEVGRFGPTLAQNRQFCTLSQISQKLFSNFSSNLAYELLMTIAYCSINFVPLESFEVGHFGSSLAQMEFPMLNSCMHASQ